MWLVICDAADIAGIWAYRRLAERGLRPLELFTAQVLATAVRVDHRVGANGAFSEIETADGRCLRSTDIEGTLNRLTWVPDHHLKIAAPPDSEYAANELNAMFLSWLSSLPGTMLNRPSSGGLAGRWRHPSEWALLAARAGLTPHPYHMSTADPPHPPTPTEASDSVGEVITVFVVSNRVVAREHLPARVREGCRRLSLIAGTPLLGIDLAQVGGRPWSFVTATPVPNLVAGGDDLVEAIHFALTS
jgi:hypothetical protein